MSAIAHVLNSGEYRQSSEPVLGVVLRSSVSGHDHENSRRFLIRIVTRAVLDVSMYGPHNENHRSARAWLMGEQDSLLSFSDIVQIAGMTDIQKAIENLAEEDGYSREKVRDVRRQLYDRGVDDDGEEQSS